VKVLDFGLAKRLGPVLSTANEGPLTVVPIGTPEYMAPEALNLSSQVDERTDQWSLAVLTYRMLAGCAAFDDPDWLKQCSLIRRHEPASLSRHVPGLPDRIQGAIRRAMSKKKEQRFDTVLDFIRAIDGLPARQSSVAGSDRVEPQETQNSDACVPEYVPPDYSVHIITGPSRDALPLPVAAGGDASGTPAVGSPDAPLRPAAPAQRVPAGYLPWGAVLSLIGAFLVVQDARGTHGGAGKTSGTLDKNLVQPDGVRADGPMSVSSAKGVSSPAPGCGNAAPAAKQSVSTASQPSGHSLSGLRAAIQRRKLALAMKPVIARIQTPRHLPPLRESPATPAPATPSLVGPATGDKERAEIVGRRSIIVVD
jgi:serine/threonine-protein kinase